MRRRLVIGLTILGAISTFGVSTQAALRPVHAAGPMKLTTVKMGYVPVADALPMYIAIDQGYFKKEGIDLKLTAMSGGAVIIPAIQGGSLDMGFSAVLPLIVADSQGLNLVDVAPGDYETRAHPSHAILVAKGSPIQHAKDLEGKRVAVNTLNSPDHVEMQQWIKDRGGDPSKVQFVELPFPQMLGPLAHGQVDAAAESEPAVTAGVSQLGMRILGYDFADEQKLTLLASYVSLRPWAQKHQALLRGFARALLKGYQFELVHPVKARDSLAKYTQMSHVLANSIRVPITRKIKTSDFQLWVKLGLRWHALSKKVNVNKMIWPTAR